MGQVAFSRTLFDRAAEHCDVRERMARARDAHRVRAHFFVSLRAIVAGWNPEALPEYDAEVGVPTSGFAMHPVREYLRQLVLAGAIIAGPERVLEGIHDVHRRSMHRFLASSITRNVINLVKLTPWMWWASAGTNSFRHLAVNYGSFGHKKLGPKSAVLYFDDEIVWPEHTMVGMTLGLFDICGVKGRVFCEQRGPDAITAWAQW